MARIAALNIPDDDKPLSQVAKTHDTPFAIVPTSLHDFQHRPGENQRRLGEIETALAQRPVAFLRIETDLHGFSVYTIIKTRFPYRSCRFGASLESAALKLHIANMFSFSNRTPDTA